MKNIKIIVLFLITILIYPSCLKTDEDFFDETADERMQEVLTSAKEVLISAGETGWIMEYFPNLNGPGMPIFVSFGKNEIATMGAITPGAREQDPATYQVDSCAWELLAEAGPVITFNTYCKVFHIYADPAPAITSEGQTSKPGEGMGGDYEFVIMKISEDKNTIYLTGKKRGIPAVLKRASTSVNWEDYFKDIEVEKNFFFRKSTNIPLTLTTPTSKYTMMNAFKMIFTVTEVGVENALTRSIPYVVNMDGIKFAKPFEFGGLMVENFKYSEDRTYLYSTDVDEDVRILGFGAVDFFKHEMSMNFSVAKGWIVSAAINETSPQVLDIIARLKAQVKDRVNVAEVDFYYSPITQSSCLYMGPGTVGKGANIGIEVQVKDSDVVSITTTGLTDDKYTPLIINEPTVKELLGILAQDWKVTPLISEFNLSKIKLVNVNDPENLWFTVELGM